MIAKEYAAGVAAHIVETGERWTIGTHEGLSQLFLREVSHILKDFNIEFDIITNTFGKPREYYRSNGVEL